MLLLHETLRTSPGASDFDEVAGLTYDEAPTYDEAAGSDYDFVDSYYDEGSQGEFADDFTGPDYE